VKREYQFLQIPDAHIACAAPDESERDHAIAEKQTGRWTTIGVKPLDAWERKEAYVREHEKNLDGLLITGDCVDYFGLGNYRFMKERFEAFPAEVLYIPGKHVWTTAG